MEGLVHLLLLLRELNGTSQIRPILLVHFLEKTKLGTSCSLYTDSDVVYHPFQSCLLLLFFDSSGSGSSYTQKVSYLQIYLTRYKASSTANTSTCNDNVNSKRGQNKELTSRSILKSLIHEYTFLNSVLAAIMLKFLIISNKLRSPPITVRTIRSQNKYRNKMTTKYSGSYKNN